MIVGIIALRDIDVQWLRMVHAKFQALVIIQQPRNLDYEKYADYIFTGGVRLGFGRARRMSMWLSSQLSDLCMVTDGDGAYLLEALVSMSMALERGDADVVLPIRDNVVLVIEYLGRTLDRGEIERFENFYAREHLNIDRLPADLDCQPGLFGFKSAVVQKIMPQDNEWGADYETTVNALRNTSYTFLHLPTTPQNQERTTFNVEDQVKKLNFIQAMIGYPLGKALQEYEAAFPSQTPERRMLRDLVVAALAKDLKTATP